MNQFITKLPLTSKEETFVKRNLDFLDLMNGDIQDVQLKLDLALSQKIRLQLKIVLNGLGALLFQEEGLEFEDTINRLFLKVRGQLNRLTSGQDEYIG